jgi:hypothetical protein
VRRVLPAALWALSFLFLLRVLGQMLVVFAGATWLPAPEEWYSGLLPYPLLLPAQLAILGLMLAINPRASRGRGHPAVRRPRLGRTLIASAAVYAAIMVVRYVISGALNPERRLLPPGIIPIVFHWVLATYLAVLGAFVLREPRSNRRLAER